MCSFRYIMISEAVFFTDERRKTMKFYIVDVFAEAKYQGNQLAVFIPERDITKEEMLQMAKEIHFSETTFILSDKQENGGYDVRIFTPDIEVPFAGHPTLGTAHIINQVFEGGKAEKIILNLGAGQIPVVIEPNGNMTMSQNQPEFGMIVEDLKAVADALSINADDIRTDFPVQWVSTGLESFIVPLKTVDAIERCTVNHPMRQKFIDDYAACNILFFCQDKDGSLRVRTFMEDTGFLEDPATGSANGDLAAYLLKYNFFGKNKLNYRVSQGSEMGRPSVLNISCELTNGVYRIEVGGTSYTVSEGEWK